MADLKALVAARSRLRWRLAASLLLVMPLSAAAGWTLHRWIPGAYDLPKTIGMAFTLGVVSVWLYRLQVRALIRASDSGSDAVARARFDTERSVYRVLRVLIPVGFGLSALMTVAIGVLTRTLILAGPIAIGLVTIAIGLLCFARRRIKRISAQVAG